MKIHQYILQRKCMAKNLVFGDISFMAILARITFSESVKVRNYALASENFTIAWKGCKQGRLHKGERNGAKCTMAKIGGNVVMIMMFLLVSIIIY